MSSFEDFMIDKALEKDREIEQLRESLASTQRALRDAERKLGEMEQNRDHYVEQLDTVANQRDQLHARLDAVGETKYESSMLAWPREYFGPSG